MKRLAWVALAALPIAAGGIYDLPITPPVWKPRKPSASKPGVTPARIRIPAPPPAPDPDPPPVPKPQPPPTFYGEELPSSDSLVYVLDRSGSMTLGGAGGWVVDSSQPGSGLTRWARMGEQGPGMWRGASRWERAQIECIRSVKGLSESIRFNIITYDCSLRVWQDKPQPATVANKIAACAWLRPQLPGGGTGTAPAVVWACIGPPDRVVLLTDGEPNCPALTDTLRWHMQAILAGHHRVPVDVFGIATSRDPTLRAWCQGVASMTGGGYYDVN